MGSPNAHYTAAHGIRRGAGGSESDGKAGTKWVPELANPEHKTHGLYTSVRDKVAGVCGFCAGAFGAAQGVAKEGVLLGRDFEGHPSLRRLVLDGYQIVTF